MAEEAHAADADVIRNSEVRSLPSDVPAIDAAHVLFASEESEEIDGTGDLSKIIQSCLRDVKWHKNVRAIKMLSQLVAVSEYVKLRTHYKLHKVCKQPCLKASIAIAHQMGKGPYFAHQIQYHELYLLKHHHLPLVKNMHGMVNTHSLLNNEAVLHDMRVYLAAQSLSTVTPRTLCHHLNQIIRPALEIQGTIVESTAQRWLKLRLGYECKETKKGVYIDGHERPDVIKEREAFIDQLDRYERYVAPDLQLR